MPSPNLTIRIFLIAVSLYQADIGDWTCMHVQQQDGPSVAATFETVGTQFDEELREQVQPVTI